MNNRNESSYQPALPLLLNIEQASELLGKMPVSTIRKYVHRGWLRKCRHPARPWYFTLEYLEEFKRRLEDESGSDD